MNPLLFADLYKAIDQWIEAHCECDVWPEQFIYPEIAKDMARAASMVFDACILGQDYAEKEG